MLSILTRNCHRAIRRAIIRNDYFIIIVSFLGEYAIQAFGEVALMVISADYDRYINVIFVQIQSSKRYYFFNSISLNLRNQINT